MLPVKAEIPATVDSIAAAKLNVLAPQQKLVQGLRESRLRTVHHAVG